MRGERRPGGPRSEQMPEPDDLKRLGERLDEIRRDEDARNMRPPPSGFAVAFRFASELLAAIIAGGAIGWGLDWLFGTRPILTVLFFLFGIAAGLRNVIQASKELNERVAAAAAQDKKER